MSSASRSGERIAAAGGLAALGLLLAATVAWWALALWPAPAEVPGWLERARWVCFNAAPGGLPDASGWLLLIGQPLGMLAVLMVGWGAAVRAGLRALSSDRVGRAALAVVALGLVAGAAGAGARVLSVARAGAVTLPGEELPPDTYPRLDRAPPALGLLDQRGERLTLAELEGRPALVTFAFAHCETVCPLLVRQSFEVQRRARAALAEGSLEPSQVPRVVVVSLDPWRDTPSRLPHLAERWGAGEDAYLLSGEVAEVNRVLDGWNVARVRDTATGDVTHPPLFYVLDASGRIAYAASGGVETLLELVRRSDAAAGAPAAG